MDIKIEPDEIKEQDLILFQAKPKNSDWIKIDVPGQTDPITAYKILRDLKQGNPDTDFRAVKVHYRIEVTITPISYLEQPQNIQVQND